MDDLTALDAFGRSLMQARDDAAASMLTAKVEGGRSTARDPARILEAIPLAQREKHVLEIIDATLGSLLAQLEWDEDIEILCRGRSIRHDSDGLPGELYTDDGWIRRFSRYPSPIDDALERDSAEREQP